MVSNDPTLLRLYAGKRILVVEDEYFLADEVRRRLVALGATVVGPAASVEEAFELFDTSDIDAAILDIHLGDEFVFPVAERLDAMGVPFVFATNHDASILPGRFKGFSLCEKPTELGRIAQALWKQEPDQLH